MSRPGRDREAKGRSERTNDVDEWVQVTDRFKKLRADLMYINVPGFAGGS